MQKNIHPGVAVVVILIVLGVAGFMLWWPNRPRPVPDHFGPLSPAQGMQMQGGSPAKTK